MDFPLTNQYNTYSKKPVIKTINYRQYTRQSEKKQDFWNQSNIGPID